MTIARSGTSCRTTAPAATIAFAPILTAREDRRAFPDHHLVVDPDAAREMRTRANMDTATELVLVIDGRGGVDDAARTDPCRVATNAVR